MRHVPEVKRNLISLSMLDKAGCIIRVESSVLKVAKGSLVLMKSNTSNGFYALQNVAITCNVTVIVNQIQDKTLVWHLMSGRMSEKGLKELEKQRALGNDKINVLGFCEECILGNSSRTRFKLLNHFGVGP